MKNAYEEGDVLPKEVSQFFSIIRFDEILFLLIYIDVCAPYEALCLKEQGIAYIQNSSDAEGDTRNLINAMGEDLLYSSENQFFLGDNTKYRYSEAIRFTEAYLHNDLPKKVKGFSTKAEMWLEAIKDNDKQEIRSHWVEMVHMVVQNFAWRNWAQGEFYLNKLFVFAKEEFLNSAGGEELIFPIFDTAQGNDGLFCCHIPVMKVFDEILGDALIGCSQRSIKVLEQFSSLYLSQRIMPICHAILFMAPAECSKDALFNRKVSNFDNIMLTNKDPIDKLRDLLKKISDEVPSIKISPNADVFTQLHILAEKEKQYMTENRLIQYDDINDHLHMLETAIKDMEHLVLLLQKVKENRVPVGAYIGPIDLSDLDRTIQRFREALKISNMDKDGSLQLNVQSLFTEIQLGDVILNEQQYQGLQDIITESERVYSNAPYFRKILLDHLAKDGASQAVNGENTEEPQRS